MKKLLFSQRGSTPHWVGDGFPVRSIFTYNDNPKVVSPFLLLDYGGPAEFKPSAHRRGVGEHPHRGFETVTIVYSGEVEHRDSAGGGGRIGPGDVQWMTAASGLVHEEKHSRKFSDSGGLFEMIQLWVNLPAKNKMTRPNYQGIKSSAIPEVALEDNAGQVRVIAGEFAGRKGPAETFTPIELWDVRLKNDSTQIFNLPESHTTLVFVLAGQVRLTDGEIIKEAELGVLDSSEESFMLTAIGDAKVLILAGQPIDEPVIGYGPFVMNSGQEIQQAMADYESGKMGQLGVLD